MNTRSGFEQVIDTPLGGFYNIRIFVFWKLINTLILSIKIDSKTETAFVINKEKFYGLLLCWLILSWFGEKCSFDWQNLKIFTETSKINCKELTAISGPSGLLKCMKFCVWSLFKWDFWKSKTKIWWLKWLKNCDVSTL